MKNINNKLCFLILTLSILIFSSCREEYESSISDSKKNNMPEKVLLLEHSSQSITVAWDFIKGATSYTVQLVESIESDYPIVFYTTSSEDYFEFSGLSKFGNYYARVRANFPHSETSDWVYVMSEGSKARIIPHLGIVDENYILETIKLLNSSSSTLTIAWSLSLFSEEASEYNNKYNVELFADATCENLVISWLLENKFSASSPARFTFSGLNSSADYYVRVEDQTLNRTSTVFNFKTLPTIITPTVSPSNKGDIIVSQDFSDFVHGGDIVFVAHGYNVGTTGRSSWVKALGENPINATTGQNVCASSAEFNVFDGGGVTTAYTEGAGMKGWGKSGNTSTRPGYMKMGGGSGGLAYLYTPELTLISQGATVTVQFKASIYKERNDKFCEDVVVQVVEGAIFNDKGSITNLSSINITNEVIVPIDDADGYFAERKVVLKNITPNSRISIGSNKGKSGQNKTRFLLDDIIISLGEN